MGDRPYGKSIGEWTVLWWNWALKTPKYINPISDDSGKYAYIGQRNDVWFLAGKFGSNDKDFPHRRCTLPYGMPILFPVLNCEANQLEYPFLKNEQDLINHVMNDVNTVIKKECNLNDKPLSPMRIVSDPRIFSLYICDDNAMGVNKGGVVHAAADGYWIFLKPLQKGQYVLQFEGSCEAGRLSAGATYDITVR